MLRRLFSEWEGIGSYQKDSKWSYVVVSQVSCCIKPWERE